MNTPKTMPAEPELPKGLLFFHPESVPAYRRRRRLFALVMAITTLAISWPLYPLLAPFYPSIFGLPPSFSWVVTWLLVSLGALIALYRTEVE